MKKIIIILPSILTVPAIKGGAVEQLLEQFIESNEKKGNYRLLVIAHFIKGVKKVYQEKAYHNTEIYYIKMPSILIRMNSILSNKFTILPEYYFKKIIGKLKKAEPEIPILIEGARKIALLIKEQFPDRKVYCHVHGPAVGFQNEKEEKLTKKLDKIITVSDFCKKEEEKLGLKKVYCNENGIRTKAFHIDPTKYSQKKICRMFHLPKDKKIILFKGRMVKEKGVKELIRAFSMIKDEEIVLVLAGSKNFGDKRVISSSYENEILQKVKKEKRIIHLGYVPYDKIPFLNYISYFSVIPSTWEEPAGLTLLEAIASGRPSIISNSGALPAYGQGKGTIVVDKQKHFAENLKKAMEELLYDNKKYEALTKEALQYRDFYDEERYYDGLCQIIQ